MITTVEEARSAGYDLYFYTNPLRLAADRKKFESLGFECIDFKVTMCCGRFGAVLYLGTRRINRPTRKERGCLC